MPTHSIESWLTRGRLRHDDAAIPGSALVGAGGPQFLADQPDSSPPGHAVHGLVQPDPTAVAARPVDRALAFLLPPGFERSQETALSQHARLLHPRAQGRSAPDPWRPRDPRQSL